jgi:hypothetical protein
LLVEKVGKGWQTSANAHKKGQQKRSALTWAVKCWKRLPKLKGGRSRQLMPLHTLAKASQVGNNQQRLANARTKRRQRRPAKKVGNECFERLAINKWQRSTRSTKPQYRLLTLGLEKVGKYRRMYTLAKYIPLSPMSAEAGKSRQKACKKGRQERSPRLLQKSAAKNCQRPART